MAKRWSTVESSNAFDRRSPSRLAFASAFRHILEITRNNSLLNDHMFIVLSGASAEASDRSGSSTSLVVVC